MRLMGMLLFMLLPLLGLAYVAWHLWMLLPLPAWLRAAVILVGAGCFALLFVSVSGRLDGMPLGVASCVYNVGTSSIIVLLYLVMLFLLLDAGRLCHVLPRAWLHHNVATTLAVVAVIAGLFVYGFVHYNNKVRVELHLKSSKPMARPVRLVLVSDVHLGYHNRVESLRRWVGLINNENADMVLLAGDLIDISVRPLLEENMAAELRRINAPVYACLGNHEYYSREPRAKQFFSDAGIHLLQDSAVVVGDLCIIGRDDRTNPHRLSMGRLARMADHTKYTILLDHQPYNLEQTERAGIDFQFSGHTHRGQVWPASWLTDAIYECSWGSHQRGATRYYVSSGLGIWGGRYRIGTQSEYVVATVCADRQP